MASRSDPDLSSSVVTESPKPERRRTKSVPASPSSGTAGDASGSGTGTGGGRMEQLQIAESPEHEAAGGHPSRRRGPVDVMERFKDENWCVKGFLWCFCLNNCRRIFWTLLGLFILFGGMIGIGILNDSWENLGYHYYPGRGQVKNDQEWVDLQVFIVPPGDPEYIEPVKGGYNPDGSKYIDELVKQYPWQSKACGMSFRNLKNEKPPSTGGPPDEGAPTGGPETATEPPKEPTEPPEEPTEPPEEPPELPEEGGGVAEQEGDESGRLAVVGSHSLKPGQFPWNLVVYWEPKETRIINIVPYCGATLIASRYAVTATHCLPDDGELSTYPYYLWVSGGAVRRDQLRENSFREHQMRRVTHIYYNHRFPLFDKEGRQTGGNPAWDIGLLAWNEPFRRLHTRDGLVVLSPACLPSHALIEKHSLSYEGIHEYAGMGETADPATRGFTDRVRTGQFVYNASCNVGDPFNPPSHYLNQCRDPKPVGVNETDTSETSHCRGDSGGSVNTRVLDPDRKRYFQSGVISFGIPMGCAEVRIVGNVRVEAHTDWISAHITNATVLEVDVF